MILMTLIIVLVTVGNAVIGHLKPAWQLQLEGGSAPGGAAQPPSVRRVRIRRTSIESQAILRPGPGFKLNRARPRAGHHRPR